MKRADLNSDPMKQLQLWLEEAKSQQNIDNYNQMCLSTISMDNQPTSRYVLLKEIDRGLIFYTNLNSGKGTQIKRNPHVAVNFYWEQLGKQIRVRGIANTISDTKADIYFASRERKSQLGAWASKQSQKLKSKEELLDRLNFFQKKFENEEVPRPPFWSGFRISPEYFEFWQRGKSRLHDRFIYTKSGTDWQIERLYP